MGGDWTKALLGDICQLKAGGAFKKELQGNSHGELPFIKVSDMNLAGNELYIKNANNWVSKETAKNIRAPIHPAGAVVFAKIGVALTYNRRRILTRDTLIDNNMMSATPDAKHVDPRFFYYLLVNIDFNKIVEGSALPYLKASTINSIDVLIPNISEQRAIAHILGTLDDKIELNRQMNRTLEAMAQALFKSWFIDFDPVVVNALRAGNPIPEKFAQRAVHYRDNPDALRLPGDALRQFPDRFQDSELGPIPEGWRVGIVSDLATIASGKRPKKRSKEKNVEFRIPLYGGGGIMAYVEEPLVTEPLLLTGRVGTLGKIFRISEPCWPSDNTLILFPKKKIYFHFVFFMLQLIEFESLNRGSTQPLVTQMDLSNQSLVIPNANVSNLFWVNVYSLFEKIDKSLEESSILSSLRDTLLPKLVSGELRVPDAEKLLEDAL